MFFLICLLIGIVCLIGGIYLSTQYRSEDILCYAITTICATMVFIALLSRTSDTTTLAPKVRNEYELLLEYKELIEYSNSDEMYSKYIFRIESFNQERERYLKGVNSFWFSWAYSPVVYEGIEEISFERDKEN